MLVIDGGSGEGGGQILRTCLALSLLTGKEFTITNIRQGRQKPGLRAQHLNAVNLAGKIGFARVEGGKFGSTSLIFAPDGIHAGRYSSNIGTAGSTALVLQTILFPLSFASKPSKIRLTGGTHVPYAPTFEFMELHWKTYLEQVGLKLSLKLEQAGFFPRGGGQIQMEINPSKQISSLTIPERGDIKQISGISAVANLDRKIAEKQRNQVLRLLGHRYPLSDIRIINLPSANKGTTICLVCEFEHSRACFTSLGEPGKPAEKVAAEVCEQVEYFLATEAIVDKFLADQLLLPLSLSEADSTYSTSKITDHLRTNADVIQLFINKRIDISGNTGSPGMISITQ